MLHVKECQTHFVSFAKTCVTTISVGIDKAHTLDHSQQPPCSTPFRSHSSSHLPPLIPIPRTHRLPLRTSEVCFQPDFSVTSSVSLTSLTKTLFNHVALPPQLPGKQDDRIDQVERALTDRLQDASRTLRDLTNDDIRNQFDFVCHTLHVCKTVNAGGKLDTTSLAAEFRNLRRNDLLILHIAEQNTGLLIRRHQQ